MAAAGVFPGTSTVNVTGLRYIRATGAEPPGEQRIVNLKDESVQAAGEKALAGLLRLIAKFDDPGTAYEALRRPRFNYDYDDYAHLARAGEWSADGGEETS